MTVSTRTKIAALAAGALATVATTAGVTYAAATAASTTSKPVAATACVNAAHQLRIASSSGACPKGDTPLTLGVAPSAITLSQTGGKNLTQTVTVGAITATAHCFGDIGGTHAQLYLSSPSAFDIQGNYYARSSSGGVIYIPGVTGQADGAGMISTAVAAGQQARFEVLDSAGTTASFEIVQGTHTISVTFANFAYQPSCSVQAQFTPSR